MSVQIARFHEAVPSRTDNPDPSIPDEVLQTILPAVYVMMGPPEIAGPERGNAAIIAEDKLFVGFVECLPGRKAPLHAHLGCTEMFLCIKGRFTFRAREGRRQTEATLGPLDMISVPAGIYRDFVNIADEPGMLLAIITVNHDAPGDQTVMDVEESRTLAARIGLEMLKKLETATGYRFPLTPDVT